MSAVGILLLQLEEDVKVFTFFCITAFSVNIDNQFFHFIILKNNSTLSKVIELFLLLCFK